MTTNAARQRLSAAYELAAAAEQAENVLIRCHIQTERQRRFGHEEAREVLARALRRWNALPPDDPADA